MSIRKNVLTLALAGGLAAALLPAAANAQSGLLTRAEVLPKLTLSAGQPLAEGPLELESGKHYKLVIEADGTAELAIRGPEFFRNVWVNEVVINDIEVRPLGVDSIEFDAAGEVEITFVTIRPGSFALFIPGTTGESQRVAINVK
ncbi:hypothetical protein ACUN0C_08565 [Faunimonas sp. B44]|uniref:hypothetical protein n=1 Tax=Faunimonas sp. B44 TaxID=3461493 RepID=UPI004043A4B3